MLCWDNEKLLLFYHFLLSQSFYVSVSIPFTNYLVIKQKYFYFEENNAFINYHTFFYYLLLAGTHGANYNIVNIEISNKMVEAHNKHISTFIKNIILHLYRIMSLIKDDQITLYIHLRI